MPSKKKKGSGNGLEYELSTDPYKNPNGDMVSAMPWIFIVHPNKCYSTKKLDLKKICSPHGKVVDIVIKSDFGLATVQMDRRLKTDNGVKQVAGIQLSTKKVVVKFETEGKIVDGQIVSGTSDPDPALRCNSSHGKTLIVENLSPLVSSSMLMKAFMLFGKVQIATVVVDAKGNSTGKGKVTFLHKANADAAVAKIQLKPFLIGSSLKPVTVSCMEEEDPEYESLVQEFPKSNNSNIEARFPDSDSFELQLALDWQKRMDMERLQRESFEKNLHKSREKFEAEMDKRLEAKKLTSCGYCKKENFASSELLQEHVVACKGKARVANARSFAAAKTAAASRLTAAANMAANLRKKEATKKCSLPDMLVAGANGRAAKTNSPMKYVPVIVPNILSRSSRKEASNGPVPVKVQNNSGSSHVMVNIGRNITRPKENVQKAATPEVYVPDEPVEEEEFSDSSRRKSMRKRKAPKYSDYETGDFNEDDKKEDEDKEGSKETNEEKEPSKKKKSEETNTKKKSDVGPQPSLRGRKSAVLPQPPLRRILPGRKSAVLPQPPLRRVPPGRKSDVLPQPPLRRILPGRKSDVLPQPPLRRFPPARQTREQRRQAPAAKVPDPASVLERKLDEMKTEVLSGEETTEPTTTTTNNGDATNGMLSPRKSGRKRKSTKMAGFDVEDSNKNSGNDEVEQMETSAAEEVVDNTTAADVVVKQEVTELVDEVVAVSNEADDEAVVNGEATTNGETPTTNGTTPTTNGTTPMTNGTAPTTNSTTPMTNGTTPTTNGTAPTTNGTTPMTNGTTPTTNETAPTTNETPLMADETPAEETSRRKSTRKRKPRKLDTSANAEEEEEEKEEESEVKVEENQDEQPQVNEAEESEVQEAEEEETNNEVEIKTEPEEKEIEEIGCFLCSKQCQDGLEVMKSNFAGRGGEDSARNFLQEHDVLPKVVQCPTCQIDCKYQRDSGEFVCIRTVDGEQVKCGYSVAERKDTICEQSSNNNYISHSQFLLFSFYYSTTQLTFSEVASNLNISNQKVIEWRRRFGEVCVNFANNQSPIGGKDIEVSIDETAITESTQNYWIFGGVEKVSKRKFLIYIKGGRPRAERLSDVIKKYVRAGSYVTCEESNGIQFKLSRLGYKLECFKTHHLPFVREIPLARTFLRYKLAHHIFTISFDDEATRFHNFLAEIAKKYPLQTTAVAASSSTTE